MNSSGDNDAVSVFTSKLTPAADICVGVLIFIIALLSVVGNGLVLLIAYRGRSRLVGSEVLCVNLALVDFFCCILFYPLSISSSFHHVWLGGSTSCTYYGLGCYVFGLCSMLTVTAISALRYLKIRHSSVYAVWITRARVQRVCGFIWLVAIVWSSLPLIGWGEYVPEPYGLSCTVAWRDFHTSTKDAFYIICSFSLVTLIPLLLIVVTQCQIIFTVSRLSSHMSPGSICNDLKRREKLLSLMFFGISLGFVISWLPYAIVSFLFIFNKGHHYMAPGGFVFPAIFAKSSHVYNPFIYFYFNRKFRKEFRELFCNLRVGQEESRVDIGSGEGEQNLGPINIQLQDQSRPQRKKRVPQDQRKDRNRSGSGEEAGSSSSHRGIKPVRTCWDSPPDSNTRVAAEKECAIVSTSV